MSSIANTNAVRGHMGNNVKADLPHKVKSISDTVTLTDNITTEKNP